MFTAEHISLASGQSYQNASILESADYESYGVTRLFGDMTLALLAQGRLVRVNLWNLRVITLDKRRRSGRNNIAFERLVLEKDIVYTNGIIITQGDYGEVGIPRVIAGGLNQFAWACDNGTMISHDANVVSIITKDPRGGNTDKVIIRSTQQIPVPADAKTKQRGIGRRS